MKQKNVITLNIGNCVAKIIYKRDLVIRYYVS